MRLTTPRLSVASRIVAAIFAGYALATVSGVFLAVVLPIASIDRGNAFMTGMLISFTVWAIAIMWCFYAKSAWRAWRGLLVGLLVLIGMIAVVKVMLG